MNDIETARDTRKCRDMERETDAANIHTAVLAGVPSATQKLLREFQTAAQSFVDEMGEDSHPFVQKAIARKHAAWFRELLK